VTVWADCLPENASIVRNAFVSILDDLAEHGATQEELEREVKEYIRNNRDPASLAGYLAYQAEQELVGATLDSPGEALAQLRSITGRDVCDAAAEVSGSLLLVVPDGSPPLGGRFKPYPVNPPDAIEGKAYRTPRKDRNEDNKDDVLVVGDSGVTFQSGETR